MSQQVVDNNWHVSASCEDNIAHLTSSLRRWNDEVFGNIFKRKERIIQQLEGINRVFFTEPNHRLRLLRDKLLEEYNSILMQEEAYWFHQAKSKWLALGHRNTRYFHQSTLARRCRNNISALKDGDENWVCDKEGVKKVVLDFYQDLFSLGGTSSFSYPTLSSFPGLSNDDCTFLSRGVSLEETKRTLFSMKNFRSPGPDEFHPLFF